MVVKVSEGKNAVQAYVNEHASQGLDHVLELVTEDHNLVLRLIGDLTEEEGMRVTPVDEWRIYDALKHMTASLGRSRERLETLSSGRPFTAQAGVGGPGGMGTTEYDSFSDLRRAYIDGMADVLAVVRGADPVNGLDLTADHAGFGPFNWMGWALYSHHVHTHDHVGQIEAIKRAIRVGE